MVKEPPEVEIESTEIINVFQVVCAPVSCSMVGARNQKGYYSSSDAGSYSKGLKIYRQP